MRRGKAARRARENSVFNARIALIHEFERQQLEKREWISFAEIIDWRSRDRIDGLINEHKYQQTLDDLRREIAAGTFFFERGHPRILFISPQYRVRRGILADLSAANEGNWVSRQRWLAWAESHSPAILTDALMLCWIPRSVCLSWCANVPFEPKPDWTDRAPTSGPSSTGPIKPTKLTWDQAKAAYADRRKELLPKLPTIKKDKAWVASMNLPRQWVFELRKPHQNNKQGRPGAKK
jgi:hypothetical protein